MKESLEFDEVQSREGDFRDPHGVMLVLEPMHLEDVAIGRRIFQRGAQKQWRLSRDE